MCSVSKIVGELITSKGIDNVNIRNKSFPTNTVPKEALPIVTCCMECANKHLLIRFIK